MMKSTHKNNQKDIGENLNTVMASLKTDDARDHIIKVTLNSKEIDDRIEEKAEEVFESRSDKRFAERTKKIAYNLVAPALISMITTVATALVLHWVRIFGSGQ